MPKEKPETFKLQNGLKATLYPWGCPEAKIVRRTCANRRGAHDLPHTTFMLKVEIGDETLYLMYWQGNCKSSELVERLKNKLTENITRYPVTVIYDRTAYSIPAKQCHPLIHALTHKVKPSLAPLLAPMNNES